MKKLLIFISIILLVATTALFASCGKGAAYWTKLTKAMDDAIEAADGLDDPDEADLADSNTSGFDIIVSEPLFASSGLEPVAAGENLTGRRAAALAVYLAIRDKYADYISDKHRLRSDVAELYGLIKDAKSKGVALTEEDKTYLSGVIDRIKAIKTELEGTVGKVYPPLHGLKGKFNLQNIDLIESALTGVQAAMEARVASVDALLTISGELIDFVSGKIGAEGGEHAE
jgi:hypothetical protein